MRRVFTVKLMLLLGGASVAAACQSSPNKKVESAEATQRADAREATQEQNELAQEQREEQKELSQEQREEQDELANERPDPAEQRELSQEQRAENRELNQEQAEDRTDLAKDRRETQKENASDVQEALSEADKEKRDFAEAARARLRRIDERAASLETTAPASPRVSKALSTIPPKRASTERDIEALNTVASRNWAKAKQRINQELASLERTLDGAEKQH